MIVRALGIEARGGNRFTDINAEDWYASDVAAAHEAGIVNGKSASLFAPKSSITREEMAVMLVRTYKTQQGGLSEASQTAGFADQANISAWAVEAVNIAFQTGLVHGRGNEVFAPKGKLTRAEAIQAIANMLNK